MTYYELFSQAKDENELKSLMKKETIIACTFIKNPDRIKAIEDAGNKVAKERGW